MQVAINLKQIIDSYMQKVPEVIKKVDEVADRTGYKATELCWMTWLVQKEGDRIRNEK